MKFTIAKVLVDGVPYYQLWKGKEILGVYTRSHEARAAAELVE